MSKRSSFIFGSFLLIFFALSITGNFAQTKTPLPDEILQKVADKLAGLETLKYTYRRELNYASEGYLNELTANIYLDFTSVDKTIGFRYQFSDADSLSVFNGSEAFELNRKAKTINVENKPEFDYFLNSSYLYDSPVTLKNALPVIIADKSIPKAVTEQKDSFVVEFILDKKTLDAFGNYFPISLDRKIIYRLAVNKSDYLPTELWHGNSGNKDFTKTNFGSIETTPSAPAENSWYFSTYLGEYKYETPPEKLLIKLDAPAPDWKLPVFETNRETSLNQYKNKVVMLEFWISFCGYCIAAVPKLNAIEEKFKNKNFKLLSINVHDTAEIISLFKKNNQPKYQILSNGEATAEAYGVTAFPTIILINKSGKVIYSGAFEAEKIEELIAKNL